MKDTSRDFFSSSFGVLMALVGSAVGLGNIWRFPYMMGENGGAAFIIIYLLCAFLLSMPIMLSEFVIGRRGQMNTVGSLKALAPGTKWHLSGYICIATVFLILSFYSVVGGWSVNYFIKSLTFSFTGTPGTDFAGMFGREAANGGLSIVYTLIFYAITAVIVGFGIKGGIEKSSRIMMPVLFILMLAMAIFSICLPGASEGVRYILRPDFSQVNGKTVASAMGQAFFSLSVGVGTICTYASYVSSKENIFRCGVRTVVADTVFAIIAGCAIMPAVFAFGYDPGEGPGLVFITLPNLFARMPAGGIIGIVFFFALIIAAFSSSISMLEVIVSFVKEKFNLSRTVSILIISLFVLVMAVLNALSQGPLNGFRIMDKELLSFLDYVTASFMMTLGALLFVLFTGWKLGKDNYMDEMTNSGGLRIPKAVLNCSFFLIKYIVPVVIVTIAVFAIIG